MEYWILFVSLFLSAYAAIYLYDPNSGRPTHVLKKGQDTHFWHLKEHRL